MAIRRIAADWCPVKTMVLVWPGNIRPDLVESYRSYISNVPIEVPITLIIQERREEVKLRGEFGSSGRDLSFLCTPVYDVWIRDWAPIPVWNETGELILVKAQYEPAYVTRAKDKKGLKLDNEAGRKLAEHFGLKLEEIPLKWDLGNLAHDGCGVGIITKRLLEDNEKTMTQAEIANMLRETLGLENVIFIDPEPGDETGHVDGLVRFINERTYTLAQYPTDKEESNGGFSQENAYLECLSRQLRNQLGSDFRLIRLPHGPIKDAKYEGISSAHGNHSNFFRLGAKVGMLPEYRIGSRKRAGSMPESVRAKEVLSEFMEVIPVPAEKLSEKGGVLNCVSWTLPLASQ